MIQEDNLLAKDLCMRLPYGVICNTDKGDGHLCSIDYTIFGTAYGINVNPLKRDYFEVQEIKPYLRPLSSMTEEEYNCVYNGHIDFWSRCDYCNSHHLDYRGLIEQGLALEAPKDMYDLNNERKQK